MLRWRQNYAVNESAAESGTIEDEDASSSCSSLMHKEVIASSLHGAVQGSTFQGGSPRCNGFIQTQGNLPPFLHAGFIIFHSLLPPPPHLSIAQTVVHLPPCATTSICSLLTWPFTSDPKPTILIKTKTHYGGFLFMLVSLSTFVCVCFTNTHTDTNLGIISSKQNLLPLLTTLHLCPCSERLQKPSMWVFISSGREPPMMNSCS